MTPVLAAMTKPQPHDGAPIGFKPDTLLPAQFFARTAPPMTPEKRLLWALLEDAWECAVLPARDRAQRHYNNPLRTAAIQNDARDWFASDATWYPMAFVNVAEALNLDPGAIRRALAHQVAARMAARPTIILPPPRPLPGEPLDHTLPHVQIVALAGGYVTVELPNGRRLRLCRTSIRPHSPVRLHRGQAGPLILSYAVAKNRGLVPDPVGAGLKPAPTPHDGRESTKPDPMKSTT